jgi:hypothetical protein
MRSRARFRVALLGFVLALSVSAPSGLAQSQTQTPEQFFGFKIGTDGELAKCPKVLEFMQHLAKTTDRVRYQELGKTISRRIRRIA